MDAVWGFSTAGRLLFGRGATDRIAAAATRAEWKRLWIVSDPALIRLGYAQRLSEPLRAAGLQVAIHEGGRPEPSIETAWESIEAARPFEPDAIVGLGGGSNLDVAKVTAAVLRHGGHPADYFGFDRVPGPTLPVLAVPTTAGTGSEVSHSAVLTDAAASVKVSMLSPHLRPAFALVDPSLTDSCPRQVTAESGIDALTHAIEAYTARRFDDLQEVPRDARAYEGAHPLGQLLAGEAIRLIGRHLRTAADDPGDRGARDAMALAATYAGMAFSNCGVALVHALEYPIGGLVHCSHGAGNGLLLPYVMRFNLPERTPQLAQIARWLRAADEQTPDAEAAEQGIEAVVALRRDIGIPDRLRELGVPREALAALAEKTAGIDRLLAINPRRATATDLEQILVEAY